MHFLCMSAGYKYEFMKRVIFILCAALALSLSHLSFAWGPKGHDVVADQLDRKDKKFKKAVIQGTYEDCFLVTVQNAARIYDYVERLDKHTPNLSYQFVYDISPMLEESLLLGGYRLAYVLNSIFE